MLVNTRARDKVSMLCVCVCEELYEELRLAAGIERAKLDR